MGPVFFSSYCCSPATGDSKIWAPRRKVGCLVESELQFSFPPHSVKPVGKLVHVAKFLCRSFPGKGGEGRGGGFRVRNGFPFFFYGAACWVLIKQCRTPLKIFFEKYITSIEILNLYDNFACLFKYISCIRFSVTPMVVNSDSA